MCWCYTTGVITDYQTINQFACLSVSFKPPKDSFILSHHYGLWWRCTFNQQVSNGDRCTSTGTLWYRTSSSNGGQLTLPTVWHALTHLHVEFVLAVALIFVQSFLYEGLMSYRALYEQRLGKSEIGLQQQVTRSFLFAASNLFSLYLMMIFMTYNGILCLSLVTGAFCGHLFFSVWCPAAGAGERPRSCCG